MERSATVTAILEHKRQVLEGKKGKTMLWLIGRDGKVLQIADQFGRLVWNRRFDGAGAVEARLAGDAFSVAQEAAYLYRSDCGELAVIEEVRLESDGAVCVKGKGAEAILAARVLRTAVSGGGGTAEAVLAQIKTCFSGKRAYPGLRIDAALPDDDTEFGGARAGEGLLSFCTSRLNPIGMHVCVTPEEDGLVCTIKRGADRSERVRLSDSFENLQGIICRRTETPNVAYVLGTDADGDEKVWTVDHSDGQVRRECFVNGKSVGRRWRNEDGELITRSEADYGALLTQLGEAALDRSGMVFTVTLNQETGYRRDYEIGDLLSIEDTGSGVCAVCRVIGVEEIIEKGGFRYRAALQPVE